MWVEKKQQGGMISPFTTHQGPDGRGLTPTEPSKPRCNRAPTELANVRRGADGDRVPPNDAGVEQPKVRRKTRDCEVLQKSK